MNSERLRAKLGFSRRRLKKIGVMVPLLAISGLLGASLSVPRSARANSGQNILETMGISIAVGTVLGASTLPFYNQPGSNLWNLAYGASAGAVTGFGILLYGWYTRSGQDEYGGTGEAGLGSATLAIDGRNVRPRLAARRFSLHDDTGPVIARNDYVAPRSASVYPAQFWTPVVSLNW